MSSSFPSPFYALTLRWLKNWALNTQTNFAKEGAIHITSLVAQLWLTHLLSVCICTAYPSLLHPHGGELPICFALAVALWVWLSLLGGERNHPSSESSEHLQFGEGAREGTEMTARARGLGMTPQRSGEHPGASLGGDGVMVACPGTQLEAATQETRGSKMPSKDTRRAFYFNLRHFPASKGYPVGACFLRKSGIGESLVCPLSRRMSEVYQGDWLTGPLDAALPNRQTSHYGQI